MGASNSAEPKLSPEQREAESIAASTGALPMLQKAFSKLANPESNTVPLQNLQQCFGLNREGGSYNTENAPDSFPVLLDQLGSSLVDQFFVPDKEGISWIEFVKGYNNCCARVSASVSLNMVLRLFLALAGKANQPLHLEFESGDSDCKINGYLLPREVFLLLSMCWVMSWGCRGLKGKGDVSLPDLNHLVLSAIVSCGQVEGGFNVWDCDILSLEVQLPAGKFVTWVMSTVPCLPDCLRQYFLARLLSAVTTGDELGLSSSSAVGDISSTATHDYILTQGRAWAISITQRTTVNEEISRAFISGGDGIDDNLLYRASAHGRGINRFWSNVEDREEGHHISPPPTTAAQMSGFPRDLLKSFMAATNNHLQKQKMNLPGMKVEAEQRDAGEKEGAEEEELELSLGLSMNGRFGVDPNAAKKIKRTTSKPEFVNQARNEEMGYAVAPVAAYGGGGSSGSGYVGGGAGGGGHLIRTCSLPTETEEEWRKRKELQTLRRMEARRKRSEKQQRNSRRNHRGLSEEVAAGSDGGSNNLVEQGAGAGGLSRTVSLTTRVGGLGLNDKEKGNVLLLPPSPPSIGSSSHGTGSSGTSESESQHGQGPTPMDTTSPTGDNMLQNGELKSPATSGARVAENSGKIAAVTMRTQANGHPPLQNRNKDTVKNMLEDMPSVSTKGVSPNGKKIEGFLYRYSKGEEVKILCVCHGLFMTPAEFVKHAGGEDVANPLKHIVVSPSFL